VAERLGRIDGLGADPSLVATNIAMVRVEREGLSAARVAELLGEQGVQVMAMGPQVLRFVTHLDLGAGDVERLEAAALAVMA